MRLGNVLTTDQGPIHNGQIRRLRKVLRISLQQLLRQSHHQRFNYVRKELGITERFSVPQSDLEAETTCFSTIEGPRLLRGSARSRTVCGCC